MYFSVSQLLISHLKNSLVSFAEQGAETVEIRLDGYISEAKAIAANSVISDDRISIETRLNELRKYLKIDTGRQLAMADLEGHLFTTDGARLKIDDREYFKKAINGEPSISDPIYSKIDGSMIIVFTTPLINQDKIIGTLSLTYPITFLSDITDKIRLGESRSAYILDSEGYTIAHRDRSLVLNRVNDLINVTDDPKLKKLAEIESKMIQGQKGAGAYFYNGINKYMGYSPIGDTGWSIGVSAPRAELLSDLNRVFTILTILIIFGTLIFLVVFSRSKFLSNKLSKHEKDAQRIADVTNLITLIINSNGELISCNQYGTDMLQLLQIEQNDKVLNIFDLMLAEEVEKLKAVMISMQLQESSASFDITLKNGDRVVYLYSSIYKDKDTHDEYKIYSIDLTDRVEQQNKLRESFEELKSVYNELAVTNEKMERLAYTDTLTKLPNRSAIHYEMFTFLSNKGKDASCALIYLDADNFKLINDSFSHSVGNMLLVEIAKRLDNIKKDNEIVGRFEGDEFVVFIKGYESFKKVQTRIETILDVFSEPFNINGKPFHICVSAGISFFPENAQDADELLRSADVAMYHAKKTGKNRYVMFEQFMDEELIQRLNMENGLRRAIEKDEFILHYQPQIDLSTGTVSGLEALLRWKEPSHGLVAPLKFIGVAEETGLIKQIGEWVLYEACSFIKELNDLTRGNYEISVNVSVVQLTQPDFVETVKKVLLETGLEPHLLELEITESMLVETVNKNIQILSKLRQLGVRLSVDDFGRGFSSLSYIKDLPINSLKIDKSFVDDIPNNDNSLIESIIHIAHQNNLVVIAEGVEELEQKEYLKKYNCDKVQGFYYSKPIGKKEVIKLLKMWHNI